MGWILFKPPLLPRWREVETYAIVTTAPNEMMARLHDRMPLILDSADHDAWLDPERDDASPLGRQVSIASRCLCVHRRGHRAAPDV